DVVRLVCDAGDAMGVVLARGHQTQVAEPEVLHAPHDVSDVDEVLRLVEHDGDHVGPFIPRAPGSRTAPGPAGLRGATPTRRPRSTPAAPPAARGRGAFH